MSAALTPIAGSSQIAAVGKDGNSLLVQFHGNKGNPGATYRYWRLGEDGDHPSTHYEAMINGASAGKHFHAHIRGRFPFEKLDS